MKNKQRGRSALKRRPRTAIPEVFRTDIEDNVVDISGASPYFKRRWDIYRALVSEQAKAVAGGRYQLQPVLFQDFVNCLRDLHTQREWRKVEPANTVAEALCWSADLQNPVEDADDNALWFVPFDETPTEGTANDPLSFLDSLSKTPAIADDWDSMGSSPVPLLEPVTLRWDYQDKDVKSEKAKKWQPGYRDDCPVVNVIPEYNHDRSKRPELSIKIEGAPVCLLMRASQAKNKDAQMLWKALLHGLSVQAGFEESTGGRPRLGKGRKAAWLRDHSRCSWRKVAKILSGTSYPSPANIENYRKQAEQYWKGLRKQVAGRLKTQAVTLIARSELRK